MTKFYTHPWIVLGALLLADVAGPGNCGGSKSRGDGALVVSVKDCTCAPAPVSVSIDGVVRGTVACGAEHALTFHVADGSHSVSGSSDAGAWPAQTVVVRGADVPVDLGCPGAPDAR